MKTREGSVRGIEQKDIIHKENKWQNGRSRPSFLLSNYVNVNGLNVPIKKQTTKID